MDREIQSQLYDPKRKQRKGSWLDFVKQHKNMRTAKGLLDLRAISKLWKGHKNYDPASRPRKAHGVNRPPKNWFAAMYQGIKKRSDVKDVGAVVGSIWKRLSSAKRASIKARETKGERFKYDLPLPDDRATRGTGTLRMVKPFKLAEVQVNISAKDYLAALKTGLFSKMNRNDGTIALVKRCKSPSGNANIFVDKIRTGGK